MCLTRPALGLPNCPLPGKEVKRGQDGAGSRWGPDPLQTTHKAAPEPNIGPEACRAGKWPVAFCPGTDAGTALLCRAGHGESLSAAGCSCPGSTCSCTLLPQALGWMGAGHLWGSASTLHRVLEECASLLTAFWSAVLPVGPAQHQGKVSMGLGASGAVGLGCLLLIRLVSSQEQVLQGEIAALRAQLSEREDALQSTAERLRSTTQLKDSMEQFIVSQRTWPGWCPAAGWPGPPVSGVAPRHRDHTEPISLPFTVTRTHNVLRKARTNLEVSLSWQPVWDRGGCPCPGEP